MMTAGASLPAPGASGLSLPRLSRRSLVTAALTLSAHLLLVFAWQHLPRASGVQGKAPSPALQVTLLPAQSPMPLHSAFPSASALPSAPAPSSASDPDSASAPAKEASQSTPDLASVLAAPPTPMQTQPAALTPSGQVNDLARAPAMLVSAVTDGSGQPGSRQQAPSAPAASLQRASNEWAYLPASELDRRPRPESDITLPFPESENLPRGTRVSAVLVLYVGVDGAVDRVEFAQSALPPAFARTATETFARVRMQPGMKDGRPRRAMMKIEVEFEAPAFRKPATDAGTETKAGLEKNAVVPQAKAVIESSRSWQDSQ